MKNELPQNIEAEEAVLGNILVDGKSIVQVADFLLPAHFYRDIHRVIYEVMLRIMARHEPIDYIIVSDELVKDEKLEIVGGIFFLMKLQEAAPTTYDNATEDRFGQYARLIEQKWTYRELIRTAGDIAASGMLEKETALEDAQAALYKIAQGDTRKAAVYHVDALGRYMTALDELHENGVTGIKGITSNIPHLDAKLGGFCKKKMYIVAGRPGDGKTALALHFVDAAVKTGKKVLFFSLEMDEEELMQRWLAMESQIDSEKLRDGTLTDATDMYGNTEWDRVCAAEERLRTLSGKLYIDDTPANSDASIRTKALRMQMEHGLDMIVLDYIQLASGAGASERKMDRRLELEQVSRSMRVLARELEIPVIVLAQLSRAVESRANRMPQLSDLREAGGFEQDANVVMLIYKSPDIPKEESSHEITLLVEKNRAGKRGPVDLWYVGPHLKFYPHAKEPQL